jgi:hypothetical protein
LRISYNVSLPNAVILLAGTACLADAYQTFTIRESAPMMTLSVGIFLTVWGLQIKPQPLLVVLCACALALLDIASDHRVLNDDSTSYTILYVAAAIGFVYGITRKREDPS